MRQLQIADVRADRSQKVLRIERALAKTLVKIGNEIQNDKHYPNDYDALTRTYGQLVHDNIRSALSIIQQIASRYVNEKTKTNPYPTDSDIKLIKEQTQKAVDSFWRKIRLSAINENTNLSAYVTMVATVSATGSLAKFTQTKINQIYSTNSQSMPLGAAIPLSSIEEDYRPERESPEVGIQKKPKLQWRTSADEKVCRICQGLDGRSWDTDDFDVPTPGEMGPTGSHINCRCILNLIMPEDAQYAYL